MCGPIESMCGAEGELHVGRGRHVAWAKPRGPRQLERIEHPKKTSTVVVSSPTVAPKEVVPPSV